ncbi:HSP70-domain-containing protein [Violaceomyces palustris]|uniref:HSP70-domain-containing protein n=1 Tax=Violaceomyces palustris TaxID=1673888 RepID=A0ACD0P2L9_9BASI|nr:HSP70-domain-containing protein [Violaceomyces palustris]
MSESTGAVIGINFGQSYSSIACINQHGRADVIANEDGERQLATRISFNGDQVYLGNQATAQLVRNAPNTIDRFVNLLGRSFAEITEDEKKRNSAQIIDNSGVPSFKVLIDEKETVLSAHEVAVKYLRSLFLTAKDFLSGVPIAGAVLSVPQYFSTAQIEALKKAAVEAGLIVLQVLTSPAAALVAYGLTSPQGLGQLPSHPDGVEGAPYPAGKELDRNVVVVDMGGSSTDVSVLAARAGIYTLLSYVHNSSVGGSSVDDVLVKFFAKEFTKKTKVTIGESDKRAWAKLRNEAEVTKRALSASNSAQCSVESLAEGVDFTGSVNRMRLDLLSGEIYSKVQETVEDALKQAGLEAAQIDEVIFAGGSARLPGLYERLAIVFNEEAGNTHLTASIDADQVIARGCAINAQTITATSGELERDYILSLPAKPASEIPELKAKATSRPFGILVPAPKEASEAVEKQVVDGQLFVTLIPAETPLPARRTFRFPVSSSPALLSFAEGTPSVRVEKIEAPQPDPEDEDDEDDEPLEPEEVRTAYVKPDSNKIAEVSVELDASKKVEVEVIVNADGSATITAREEGSDSSKAVVAKIPSA